MKYFKQFDSKFGEVIRAWNNFNYLKNYELH